MTNLALGAALGLGLRDARCKAGLTQVRLGAEAGLDPSTVAGLERGVGTLTSLHKVLSRLGLTLRSRALPEGPVGPALAHLRRRLRISRRASPATSPCRAPRSRCWRPTVPAGSRRSWPTPPRSGRGSASSRRAPPAPSSRTPARVRRTAAGPRRKRSGRG